MELVEFGNGAGMSLTPGSLAWATVEDGTITSERKKDRLVYIVCLTGLLVIWLALFN